MNWIDDRPVDDIPRRGARCVATPHGEIAVFRTADDRVFALEDRCPHKGGPLSQGIVHGAAVTCPLHNWVISLETGEALGADEGCGPDDPGQGRGRAHRSSRSTHAVERPHDGHPNGRGARGAHHLPLLRRRLRRAGRGRRGRRGDRPRRPGPSGQFRPALLEGLGARRNARPATAACSIPRSAASAPAGTRRSTSSRDASPRRSPRMGRTRSPSTSPASC